MYTYIKSCYPHGGIRGKEGKERAGWAILKKHTVWGDKRDQLERKLTEPKLRASQTQCLSKPAIGSTSRATESFGVWGFCFSGFVFSWSAQTGPTGPCTLFCSWHILPPPTPSPSLAKDMVCMTISQADGLKGREGAQTLTPQMVNVKNSPLACKVKVSLTAISKLLTCEWGSFTPCTDRQAQWKQRAWGINYSENPDVSTKENPTCESKRVIGLWNLLNNWIGN